MKTIALILSLLLLTSCSNPDTSGGVTLSRDGNDFPYGSCLGQGHLDYSTGKTGCGWVYVNEGSYYIMPGIDLSGANLSGADLWDANLNSANLSGANLIDADLYRGNLSYANLSGANLMDARVAEADLREASLQDAQATYAVLGHSDFTGANLSGMDLRNAILGYAILNSATLTGAILDSADLQDAALINANLSGLRSAHSIHVQSTDFTGADMTGFDYNWGVQIQDDDLDTRCPNGKRYTSSSNDCPFNP